MEQAFNLDDDIKSENEHQHYRLVRWGEINQDFILASIEILSNYRTWSNDK